MKKQTSAPLPRSPRRGRVVRSGDMAVFVSNADLSDAEIKKMKIELCGNPSLMSKVSPFSIRCTKGIRLALHR